MSDPVFVEEIEDLAGFNKILRDPSVLSSIRCRYDIEGFGLHTETRRLHVFGGSIGSLPEAIEFEYQETLYVVSCVPIAVRKIIGTERLETSFGSDSDLSDVEN